MYITVKKDAAGIYCRRFTGQQIPNREWADLLRTVQGKRLEVDTKYLFTNSVNAIDYNDKGERFIIDISRELIESIEGDVRIGMYKCAYCGRQSREEIGCQKCQHESHNTRLF